MIVYAIKLGNLYFKDYEYATKQDVYRYSGNTALGSIVQEGDIVDIILSEKPERKETKRSLGSTIATLYQIEKIKRIIIEIIPMEE